VGAPGRKRPGWREGTGQRLAKAEALGIERRTVGRAEMVDVQRKGVQRKGVQRKGVQARCAETAEAGLRQSKLF
jgi:hypothetical protein